MTGPTVNLTALCIVGVTFPSAGPRIKFPSRGWTEAMVTNDEPRGLGSIERLIDVCWCPRRDSNPGTWLRRPMLYPLSYEGSDLSLLVRFAALGMAMGPSTSKVYV